MKKFVLFLLLPSFFLCYFTNNKCHTDNFLFLQQEMRNLKKSNERATYCIAAFSLTAVFAGLWCHKKFSFLKTQNEELEEKINDNNKELEKKINNNNNAHIQNNNARAQEFADLLKQINLLETKVELLETKVEANEKLIVQNFASTNEQINKLKEDLKETDEKLDEWIKDIRRMSANNEKNNDDYKKQIYEFETISDQIYEIQEENKNIENKFVEIKNLFNKLLQSNGLTLQNLGANQYFSDITRNDLLRTVGQMLIKRSKNIIKEIDLEEL